MCVEIHSDNSYFACDIFCDQTNFCDENIFCDHKIESGKRLKPPMGERMLCILPWTLRHVYAKDLFFSCHLPSLSG